MKVVYSVTMSCAVLQVSHSGYFCKQHESNKASGERCSEAVAVAHIRSIHAEVKGEYGWPRMQKGPQARGTRIGKEGVRKLMQQYGIQAATRHKFVVTLGGGVQRCLAG